MLGLEAILLGSLEIREIMSFFKQRKEFELESRGEGGMGERDRGEVLKQEVKKQSYTLSLVPL